MLYEIVGFWFGLGKNDCAIVRIELLNHVEHSLMSTIILYHQSKMLNCLWGPNGFLFDQVDLFHVFKILFSYSCNPSGNGGRKHHVLSFSCLRFDLIHDPFNVKLESLFQHSVSLIQAHSFHIVESDNSFFHEIYQSPRGGNNYSCSPLNLFDLLWHWASSVNCDYL